MTTVTKKFDNVMDGVDNLIKAIKADYCDRSRWSSDTNSEIRTRMEKEFCEGISVKIGKKYISIYKKLGSQSCIWGGVVNTDKHKKFKKGDILMANGYNSFAQNAARGSVLEGGFRVQWTGANYLI